jgi:F0F1-type ATP synthase epsilon subunit
VGANEDIPEDYIEAAAAVVEAARSLDEARDKFRHANDAVLNAHREQESAQQALHDALERLKKASTGRTRQS